jgi:hypothetical protein
MTISTDMPMTPEFFHEGLRAYRKLFWPEFVQHDDCVFLAFDETPYRQWIHQTGGDKRKVEATMNHRHIVGLLLASVESPTRELIVEFGQLLREVWETKLRHDFPTRRFCVSFSTERCAALSDYEITFYQAP